jgi:hypothetical protein
MKSLEVARCQHRLRSKRRSLAARIRELEAERDWLAKRSDDLQTESNQWRRRAEKAEAELRTIKEWSAAGLAAKEAATIERCLADLERTKARTGSNNGRAALDAAMESIRGLAKS